MKTIFKFTPLKDLCDDFRTDIVDGPFGANLKRTHFTKEGVPVLKIQNIKPYEIVPKKMDFVCSEKATELKRHAYKKGDIIMTKLGLPLGVSAIVDDIDDGIIVADLVRVRAAKVDTKYLCYHLNSPFTSEFLNAQSTGATRPRVKITSVRELPIATPPLPEQHRIVSILDEVFEGIGKAVGNTERNLENSRELFDRYLEDVFKKGGTGWKEKTLNEACSLFVDSAHRTPKYQSDGIPALRPRDVVNGNLTFENVARVSREEYTIQSKRHEPKAGDIVYSRELSFGWAALLPESPKVCLSQGMCLFRPSSDVDSSFFVFFLNSPIGRTYAKKAAVGTAHPHINLGSIKSYPIPVPPLRQQVQMKKKFEEFQNRTQSLCSIYQKKLYALAELKQSILQKAFTGELTSKTVDKLMEPV